MDDPAQNAVAERTCTQCGTRAAAGLIFCAKCGTVLRTPAPLIQPGSQDVNPPSVTSTKGIVVTAIKYLAGISAVVFWLCPLRTGTQVLVFVASIAVLVICHSVLSNMDEAYANKHAGYWPKPFNWSTPLNPDAASEKRAGAKTKT